MNILLNNLYNELEEFNEYYNINFDIDTIRTNFNKTHLKIKLDKVGQWQKLTKNSNILKKLQKKEKNQNITTAYKLKNNDIYYYNLQDPPKYRKARLVIFGLKQYEQNMSVKQIPVKIIDQVLEVISNSVRSQKNSIEVDVCWDMSYSPEINKLEKNYKLKQYVSKSGKKTDTYYINQPDQLGINKVIIYNKAFKNNLESTLYRVEATITIYNPRDIYLPLDDLLREFVSPLQEYNVIQH